MVPGDLLWEEPAVMHVMWWWAPPCPLQGQPAWEKAQVGESMYFHTLQLSRGSSPIEADQIDPKSKIK